jgi:hypothetical protein
MSNSESNTIVTVETATKKVADVATREAAVAAPKRCRPFSLSIMVYSPESGYKFEIEIEKSCTATNDTLWKFVFMLSKKNPANDFNLLVSIKFTATTPEEAQGIASITKTGLTDTQFATVNNDIYPLTKKLGDEGRNPTSAEQQKIDAAAKKIATAK